MKILKKKENILLLLVLGFVLMTGTVIASNISADNVKMKDNPSTTVKSRLDGLVTKAISSQPTNCPSDFYCHWKKTWENVELGDYVRMIPTVESYTTDANITGAISYYNDEPTTQTIYPSQLKLWRVIKKNGDGTVEMVSEYLPSTDIIMGGAKGFANYVGYLNVIANQYQNSTYTQSARAMGYNGQTEYITDTSAFDGTSNSYPWVSATPSEDNQKHENEALGGGDTLYATDVDLVNNAIGTLSSKQCDNTACSSATEDGIYYLASRRYSHYSNSTSFGFTIPQVSTGNSVNGFSSFIDYNSSSGWRIRTSNYINVRPILTVKSGITVSAALGTKDDPFIFS